MKRALTTALAGIGAVFLFMTVFSMGVAVAHTGSPAPTVWSSGNTLTAANLNDTVAHIHNTLSGGIVDAHISTSAAIAHSKLARPGLVAKAVLSTTTACVGGGAAGTDCTVGVEQVQFLNTSGGAGVGNSALEAGGANGTYILSLNYSPTDANFMINVTSSGTTRRNCGVLTRGAGAPAGVGNFTIACWDEATAALADTNIMVTVFDTN